MPPVLSLALADVLKVNDEAESEAIREPPEKKGAKDLSGVDNVYKMKSSLPVTRAFLPARDMIL